jgi:hypothetical protein
VKVALPPAAIISEAGCWVMDGAPALALMVMVTASDVLG